MLVFLQCPGAEPYPADTIRLIIVEAARAIAAGKQQQSSINTAVQFLALLKLLNQTAFSDELALAFVDELNYSQITPRRGPEYTQEILLLSLSAGLTQAVYKSLALVRLHDMLSNKLKRCMAAFLRTTLLQKLQPGCTNRGANVMQAQMRQTRVQLVAQVVDHIGLNSTSAITAKDAVVKVKVRTPDTLLQLQCICNHGSLQPD